MSELQYQNEVWADIPGYVGFYQASSMGRLRSVDHPVKHYAGKVAIKKGKILDPRKTEYGYLRVTFSVKAIKKQHAVHRLIALALLPNPENKPQVNHINGIKSDNRVDNLEWATGSENMIHASNTGLLNQRKDKNNFSKHCKVFGNPRKIIHVTESLFANIRQIAIGRCDPKQVVLKTIQERMDRAFADGFHNNEFNRLNQAMIAINELIPPEDFHLLPSLAALTAENKALSEERDALLKQNEMLRSDNTEMNNVINS